MKRFWDVLYPLAVSCYNFFFQGLFPYTFFVNSLIPEVGLTVETGRFKRNTKAAGNRELPVETAACYAYFQILAC
jgi:hypothetical protein